MNTMTAYNRVMCNLMQKYPLGDIPVLKLDGNGNRVLDNNGNVIESIEINCRHKNIAQLTNVYLNCERRQRLFDLAKEIKSNIEFLKDCPLPMAEL